MSPKPSLLIALTTAIMVAPSAKADWMQSFTFTSPALGITNFDITNAAFVGPPLSALSASMSRFSDPFWTWFYLYPESVEPESNLEAEGGPDQVLTFSVDFASSPSAPIQFDFDAFNCGGSCVFLGAALASWNGSAWTMTQIESDEALANLVATPEPTSWLLLFSMIGLLVLRYRMAKTLSR